MNELTFRPSGLDDATKPNSPGDAATVGAIPQPSVLVRYLAIAKRWKWLLLGSIVVALFVGMLVTLLTTPQYTASATVEIQREGDRVVNVEGVQPESNQGDAEFYQTQYGLLKSRSLAERVVTDLRLQDDPAFFELFKASAIADALREGTAGAAVSDRQQRVRDAAGILLANVDIAPQRLSRLVDVTFTSPDAAFSARLVNAWTRLFIETSLARRYEATSYARGFLEKRLEELRQRLQQSERELVNYAAAQRIINIPAGTTNGSAPNSTVTTERPLLAEDLAAINQQLNDATAARIAAQSRLGNGGGSSTESLTNPAITDLRTRRSALTAERARLLAQFQPDYPPARAIEDQIAELDRALTREEGRVQGSIRSTYDAAAARENMLRGRVKALETGLLDLRRRTIQYNIYQREVDTNRQLYDGLLQRYKEIGIAGGVGANNISIVDAAEVPTGPSSPNLMLNMLIAALAGVAIGVALSLALEQIDETVSDPRQLETALGLPLLGTIPRTDKDEEALEVLEDPKSPLVEAYLSAQTRLSFTTNHGIPRTMAVTSTRPGEGKSTTAFALARSLARGSRRVVIVDGDMRSPSLHHMFGVANQRGLSDYLSGNAEMKTLLHSGFRNGLTLLAAGPTPPNAAELLDSELLRQLLAELLSQFDHVVIDSPPVLGLADTPLIASAVEGTVFVIEAHQTRSSMARVALGRLRDSTGRVVGALLTKFETKRANYGYGYDYGYGYGDPDAKST